MDGAKPKQEVWMLLLPLSLPGIASTALLSIILCWNEAFWSLNLTASNAAPLTDLHRLVLGAGGPVLGQALGRLDDRDRADPRLRLDEPAPARARPHLRRRQVIGRTAHGDRHPQGHREELRRRPGHQGRRPADRGPRVLRLRRPVRLRQVHPPADDRRARGDHRGRPHDRRPARQRRAAVRSRPRHGVPVLRALPAHVGRATTWASRSGSPARPRRSAAPRSARRPRVLHLDKLLDRKPEGALGRPAPARRDRPGHRAQAEGLPVRRAALEPRRRPARADAHRARAAARRAARRP